MERQPLFIVLRPTSVLVLPSSSVLRFATLKPPTAPASTPMDVAAAEAARDEATALIYLYDSDRVRVLETPGEGEMVAVEVDLASDPGWAAAPPSKGLSGLALACLIPRDPRRRSYPRVSAEPKRGLAPPCVSRVLTAIPRRQPGAP